MTARARRHLIRTLCAELGVSILPFGVGMLLRGPAVYLMCTDLGDVVPSELIT
ncbi:hypothetical protein [Variovorax arabinosiphilus]|uniref:hypothetical protein n=1 Tax=Variovorax arabinosiphilus TaxID=3053498 RepID=UPI002577BAB6|nr:hypothetical protein [Variovorax sp. J2L1-63]MDM0129339.1 hypothetical protein [Variovorax sp. J2L1-63]